MSSRILAVAALALAPLVQAAPVPFPKPAAQADVEIRGAYQGPPLAGVMPQPVTSEAAYRGLAEVLGIKSPPMVDFRTHFLLVHVSTEYGGPRFVIADGDLRTTGGATEGA